MSVRCEIADVLGVMPRLPDGTDASAPRASGTLKAHYAPRTPLSLLPFASLEPLLAAHPLDAGKKLALVARVSSAGRWADAPNVHFIAAPDDPQSYARELYGLLRALGLRRCREDFDRDAAGIGGMERGERPVRACGGGV